MFDKNLSDKQIRQALLTPQGIGKIVPLLI